MNTAKQPNQDNLIFTFNNIVNCKTSLTKKININVFEKIVKELDALKYKFTSDNFCKFFDCATYGKKKYINSETCDRDVITIMFKDNFPNDSQLDIIKTIYNAKIGRNTFDHTKNPFTCLKLIGQNYHKMSSEQTKVFFNLIHSIFNQFHFITFDKMTNIECIVPFIDYYSKPTPFTIDSFITSLLNNPSYTNYEKLLEMIFSSNKTSVYLQKTFESMRNKHIDINSIDTSILIPKMTYDQYQLCLKIIPTFDYLSAYCQYYHNRLHLGYCHNMRIIDDELKNGKKFPSNFVDSMIKIDFNWKHGPCATSASYPDSCTVTKYIDVRKQIDYISLIIDYCDKVDQNMLLTACRYGNEKAYDKLMNNYKFIPTQEYIEDIQRVNIPLLFKILSYKLELTEDIIINIIKGMGSREFDNFISLIRNQGVVLNKSMIEMLITSTYDPVSDFAKYNIEIDESLYYQLYKKGHPIKWTPNIKIAENIVTLRYMCRSPNKDELIKFMKNNNVKFDRYCIDILARHCNNMLCWLIAELKCEPTPFTLGLIASNNIFKHYDYIVSYLEETYNIDDAYMSHVYDHINLNKL